MNLAKSSINIQFSFQVPIREQRANMKCTLTLNIWFSRKIGEKYRSTHKRENQNNRQGQ